MTSPIQPSIDALNALLKEHPRVLNVLLKRRYPAEGGKVFTAMALVNAALEPITGEKIAFKTTEAGEIVGFSSYKEGK